MWGWQYCAALGRNLNLVDFIVLVLSTFIQTDRVRSTRLWKQTVITFFLIPVGMPKSLTVGWLFQNLIVRQ